MTKVVPPLNIVYTLQILYNISKYRYCFLTVFPFMHTFQRCFQTKTDQYCSDDLPAFNASDCHQLFNVLLQAAQLFQHGNNSELDGDADDDKLADQRDDQACPDLLPQVDGGPAHLCSACPFHPGLGL